MDQPANGKRSATAISPRPKQEATQASGKRPAADAKKERPQQSVSNSQDLSPQKVKVVAASGPGHKPPSAQPVPTQAPGQSAQSGQKNGGGSLPHPKIGSMDVQYKLNVLTNNGGMLRVADLRAQLMPGQPALPERRLAMPDKLPLESQKPFKAIRCASLTQPNHGLEPAAPRHEGSPRGVPQQRLHPRRRLARQVRQPRTRV